MKKSLQNLARRERQVLETVYSLGEANAEEVLDRLPDSPSYSTVRKVLSILEEKGYIRHTEHNRRYVYHPTQSRKQARLSELKHLMDSLFESSAESVVSTLLDISDAKMSDDDLKRLSELIEKHRKERE
jgi:predicted transcriptional regulator